MDTSETYITMCEKATEIQAIGQERHRDTHAEWWTDKQGAICTEDDGFYFYEPCIWLPRQDQLQDMIPLPSDFHRVCDKLYKFTDWVKVNATYESSACTLEQMWLAFVMYEKHGKVWDGKDWVKEQNDHRPVD